MNKSKLVLAIVISSLAVTVFVLLGTVQVQTEDPELSKLFSKYDSVFKSETSILLMKTKNRIEKRIKEYKKNIERFANDITDLGSQIKMSWFQVQDFFGGNDSNVENYVAQFIDVYFPNEEKIKILIEEEMVSFNKQFESIIDNITYEIYEKALLLPGYLNDIYKEEEIIKMIANKMSVLSKADIKIEHGKISTRTFSCVGGSVCSGIIGTKLITSTFLSSCGKLAGPIGLAISVGVDLLIGEISKNSLIDEFNPQIDSMARKISENVYKELRNICF